MIKKTHASALLLSTAVLTLPTPTLAYEADDVLLRVGLATVTPESKSDDIKQAAGEAVTADDNTQLGFSGTYMVTNQIGIEVLAVTPFAHDIEAKGGTLDGTSIAEIDQLPPTVSVQYFFLDPTSDIQPYLGAGLNITLFFNEELSSELKAAGYKEITLDDSVGLAVQAGIDYKINDQIFLNASVMYAKISTEATIKENNDNGAFGPKLTVNYDLDPMVYRLNIGYKF